MHITHLAFKFFPTRFFLMVQPIQTLNEMENLREAANHLDYSYNEKK
jgi:hypothetical protein